MVIEEIIVRIKGVFEKQGFEQSKAAMERLREASAKMRISTKEVQRRMERSGITLMETGRWQDLYTGKLMKTKDAMGVVGRAVPRFQMHLLSVMFFGMQLQRTFTGLIGPILEVTGVFEIWKAVLIDLMYPVMMPLIDIFMYIANWIMNLSEETKKHIGKLILLGAVVGIILSLLGIFGLGIQGLIILFNNLTDTGIPLLDTFIKLGIGAVIAGFLVKGFQAVYSIIKPMLDKFMKVPFITDKLRAMGVAVGEGKTLFQTLKDTVVNAVGEIGKALGLATADIEKMKIAAEETFTAAGEAVKGTADILADISGMLPTMKELFAYAKKGIMAIKVVINAVQVAIDSMAVAIGWMLKPWYELFGETKKWGDMMKYTLDILETDLAELGEGWEGLTKPIEEATKEMEKQSKQLKTAAEETEKIKDNFQGIIKYVRGVVITGGYMATTYWAKRLTEAQKEAIGLQMGGYISRTGLYRLHAGEMVTPAGAGALFAPTINISATVSSEADIDILARRLSDFWREDLRRMLA